MINWTVAGIYGAPLGLSLFFVIWTYSVSENPRMNATDATILVSAVFGVAAILPIYMGWRAR